MPVARLRCQAKCSSGHVGLRDTLQKTYETWQFSEMGCMRPSNRRTQDVDVFGVVNGLAALFLLP